MSRNTHAESPDSRLGSRMRSGATVALAGLLPAVLGWIVYRQGFHLLHDGHWLLGTQVMADGGVLYRDLFTVGGPARYLLLLPFYRLTGESALSLVLLRAVTAGCGAALGYAYVRRLGVTGLAWLVPAGVLAIGPIAPDTVLVAALAWSTQVAVGTSPSIRRWLVVSALWGLLTTFGVRGLALGSCIVPLTMALAARRPGFDRRGLLLAATGPITAVVILGLVAWAWGSFGAAVYDAWTSPLAAASDRLRSEGLSSWLRVFRAGSVVTHPFAELHTGEELGPAWTGHAGQRAAAVRMLLLWPWILPAIAVAVRRRRRGSASSAEPASETDEWQGALALSLTACLGLLLHADRPGLELAWLASLWLLPGLVATRGTVPVWPSLAGLLIFAAGFGPLLAEQLWLVRHAGRPGLERWTRPSAGIDLDHRRIENLESTFAAVADRLGAGPALIWPIQPGLHALMGVPLATRQVVLLPHTVRDVAGVLAELESTRPTVAFLGMDTSYAQRLLRTTEPELWSYLRHHYAVVGNVVNRPDEFRVLRRVGGGYDEILQLALPDRIPQLELGVSNDVGPAMREGITVGQTFLAGDTDLAGIAVRWRTSGRPVDVPVRVRIWQREGPAYTTLLEFVDVDVVIPNNLHRSYLRLLEPLVDTAGQDLAVTLELREDTVDEIRLLWHRHDAGELDADLYPEGSAVVNLKPIEADLYFLAY